MPSFGKRLGPAYAVSALAAAGLIGVAAPVSAAQAPPAAFAITSAAAARVPNVDISGKPAAWHPDKLTVKPKKYKTCTSANRAWTITNETKKAQLLSYSSGSSKKRHRLGYLGAGKKDGVCSEGPAGAKSTFYIKGSKSTLKLTLK